MLARQRLEASIVYLRVLGGESILLESYVKWTLGIEPSKITEDELAKQRAVVSDRLFQSYEIGFSRNEMSRFQARLGVYNRQQLPSQFERFRDKWGS